MSSVPLTDSAVSHTEAPAEMFEPTFDGVSHQVYTFTLTAVSADVHEGTLHDGRTAVLPCSELPPTLRPVPGARFSVSMMVDGPRPVCSASTPDLVAALYAGVTPELRTGEVRIMNVVRTPGVRSKVAVAATTTGVDPVAALVGREANRVTYVSRQLGGERIDVVPYSPDLAQFARNAMAPAVVEHVELAADKVLVFVRPHQMPAAVGNGGLNSHLAGELLGLPVEVKEFRHSAG